METNVNVEIPKTGFPHRLAKRLLAFRTVPTGSAAVNTQNNKTGHFTCYQNRTFSLATDSHPPFSNCKYCVMRWLTERFQPSPRKTTLN